MSTDAFTDLADEIAADPDNAWATALGYRPVFVAAPGARVVIIGQAPGRAAQESGIPFSDASGVRLIEWLGVDEPAFRDPDRFAILPMDFYYPGKGAAGDLPPRPGFADRWHPRILERMPDVRLTLLLGDHAQRHVLGPKRKRTLTDTVRAYREYLPRFPLPHPSPLNFRWQARNPWFVDAVVPALQDAVAAALR